MKYILFLIIIINFTSSSIACGDASLNKIFPIAYGENKIVVLETHLRRIDLLLEDKLTELAWNGVALIKIYDYQNNERYSDTIDQITLMTDQNFDSVMLKLLDKALVTIREIPNLDYVLPDEISVCDFRTNCKHASLGFNEPQKKMTITPSISDDYTCNINLTTEVAKNVFRYLYNIDEDLIYTKESLDYIYINSTRYFNIGDKKLLLVNLACGQEIETYDGETYPPGKEHDAKIEFNSITTSLYQEKVLWHGSSFDYMIIL